MTQIFTLITKSQEGRKLLSQTINHQVSRVAACLTKIYHITPLAARGDVLAILTLHGWYREIRKVEQYFDKEIKRLTKLIKRKHNASILPLHKSAYHLKVSTPISVALYRLIEKFDRLAFIGETCEMLGIFNKKRVLVKKSSVYKKQINRIISQISQHKVAIAKFPEKLTPQQQSHLSIALIAMVMPTLPEKCLRALQEVCQARESVECDVTSLTGAISPTQSGEE